MTERPTFVLLFHSERGKKGGREKVLAFSSYSSFLLFTTLVYICCFFFLPRKGKKLNFRYLCVLIIVKRFIFWVRVRCVGISIMVRFIVTNVRSYRCGSAGL